MAFWRKSGEDGRCARNAESPPRPPSPLSRVEAHLAVAGEGGVVKQEVGTEEEDDGVEHPQARPVEEDGPAEEGVLRDVPVAGKDEFQRSRRTSKTFFTFETLKCLF